MDADSESVCLVLGIRVEEDEHLRGFADRRSGLVHFGFYYVVLLLTLRLFGVESGIPVLPVFLTPGEGFVFLF